MILRPLEPPPAASPEFQDAWPAIEHIQRQVREPCWLITQPSHSALAGELAAVFSAPQLPQIDAAIVRAIALHDAGWGMPDAHAIQQSRSKSRFQPESFLQASIPVFLAAWQKSIETAQSVSPAGGYMVSRHFQRLAQHRIDSANDAPRERQKLQSFVQAEALRQKSLAAAQPVPAEQLELLADLLQFCDLLSLYICCGSRQNVVFPQYFGCQVRITSHDDGLHLDPAIIQPGSEFSVAALRHPPLKESSGREILARIKP